MEDLIDAFTPGQFDLSNAAELVAVIIGGYLIVEGRVNIGLILVGIGLGYDNISKLKKNEP